MNELLACRKQGKQALVAATILQKLNNNKMKTPIQELIEWLDKYEDNSLYGGYGS